MGLDEVDDVLEIARSASVNYIATPAGRCVG